MQSAPPPMETLSGLVERVTFHNEENGFCVLRIKARGRRDLVTVVGHAAVVTAGELVQASGEWVNDPVHGQQFRARFLKPTPPTTVEGIEKYLASGMIRGVGPAYAKKLVRAFGTEVFEVVENEPHRLAEVSGIGPKRKEAILGALAEQKAVREIMLFLHGHGVGTSRAVRIFKTYGTEAVRIVTENPYALARDIRGIGFATADRIAGHLGIEKTAMIRARAGISHALAQALDQGHCGLPRDEVLPLAADLLDIPQARLLEALALELAAEHVIADTVAGRDCVFLAGLYRAEKAIAERTKMLARGHPPWSIEEPDKAVAWVEQRVGMALGDRQKSAIRVALVSKVMVITGGPGVGKTTLTNALLEILAAKRVRMALGAPTGRAAKRVTEATGREARTIHRLLEADPRTGGFRRGAEHRLDCDLVVIDETSMVDVPLMNALLRAVPEHAAVIFVGDIDQLPSVGPGQVLADLIASGAVPVVHLTEVFRQAAASRIVANAHRINAGVMPDLAPPEGDSDFYFVEARDPQAAADRLIEIVRERIPRRFGLDSVRDIQVLCPMNRGGLGARSLNVELQKALNAGGVPRIDRFGFTFAVGDKVMQTENDYEKEVYNGDIGFIRRIDLEMSEMSIDFDGRDVAYGFGELDALLPAYATTIHKSQGSEYPAVVIPITTQHYTMLQRNLLYTGVTRARKLLVLVGTRQALAIAVRNVSGRRRWSKLREWLA